VCLCGYLRVCVFKRERGTRTNAKKARAFCCLRMRVCLCLSVNFWDRVCVCVGICECVCVEKKRAIRTIAKMTVALCVCVCTWHVRDWHSLSCCLSQYTHTSMCVDRYDVCGQVCRECQSQTCRDDEVLT